MTTPDPYQDYKDREYLRDCRRYEVGRILGDMRYQTRPGVHTVGACHNGCGNSAQGSGVCKHCLRDELAKEVGANFADAFTAAYYESRRIEDEIWEEVER